MPTRLPNATRTDMCDAAVDLIDAGDSAGEIRIYSGSQPASANDAASGTLLATFTLSDPAFGSATNGVATLSGTPLSTAGDTDGTAGWFRVVSVNAGSPTTVFDGAVGTTGSGQQLELNTTTISEAVNVEITSGTFTMPSGE